MRSWDPFSSILVLSILERQSSGKRKEGSKISFVRYALDMACHYIGFILAFGMAIWLYKVRVML
jgi:hypothetical protein